MYICTCNNTATLGGAIIYACESIVALSNDLLFDIYLDDNHCILYKEKDVDDNNSTARTRVQSFNVLVAASSNDCPTPTTVSDKEPCLTLQQYIQSSGVYNEAYNLTVQFQPGQYNLIHDELSFANKIFLLLRGPNVTIQCSDSATLRMNTIHRLHVSGINIVGCEFYVIFVGNFLMERSTFRLDSILYIQKTTNATIRHSSFSDRPCCQLIKLMASDSEL